MKNLAWETDAKIEGEGRSLREVAYVAVVTDRGWRYMTYEAFQNTAKHVNYDDGFGSPEINQMLHVVFNDGAWLERAEYDGSEWWELKVPPSLEGISTSDDEVDAWDLMSQSWQWKHEDRRDTWFL